jgi:hypothetical protein
MTHDELLKKIQVFLVATELQSVEDFEGTKMLKALRAVVELHKPIENEGRFGAKYLWCCHCWDGENDVEYPCPTIQAIEKDLG